ncbi:MAG: hypothetical protein M3R36_10855 [Bacteroidota bacterium]|nr:hypothetical protein [Bacteroidota bacterium]
MIKTVALIFIFTNFALPQISPVSTDTVFTGNFLQTNLYNDVNVANLNSIANYTSTFDNFGVSVGNYYLSNVSKLGQNFFRDYNNFQLLLFYNLKENLDAGVGFQNKFFTDDKNIKTNKNNSNYFFTNLNYALNESVFLNSRLGIKTEDQIGEFNMGFSGIFTASANNYLFSDYLTNGKLILFYENLMQKQNHNYEINGGIYKRFTQQADNNSTIRFYNLRNDFYFPATASVINQYNVKNNIESRNETYLELGDNLNYSLTNELIVSLGGFFVNRNVKKEFKYRASSSNILFENVYDTKILENNLELNCGLSYNWNKILSQIKLFYNERSENHSLINPAGLTPSQIIELERAEKNKNNNSRRTSLLLEALYFLSNTNSFGFSGSSSLLRYDTDFDQNFDDRDEPEIIISGYHIYDNLINFDVQTRFDVILSRLSYIFSQRSANNYKNKIYKLTSQSTLSPVSQLTTKNFFQVLANYTVYDYEDIVSQIQSFSYRQLNIRDSTSYNFTRDFSLDFIGELKLYEQGQFNNNNFSVKPIAYYVDQLYTPYISYFYNYFINFSIGYKYFQQQRFQYENTVKQLVNTYRSFGPVGKIILYFNNNSIINFTGGLDYIKYDNPTQDNSAIYLQLNIMWNM